MNEDIQAYESFRIGDEVIYKDYRGVEIEAIIADIWIDEKSGNCKARLIDSDGNDLFYVFGYHLSKIGA